MSVEKFCKRKKSKKPYADPHQGFECLGWSLYKSWAFLFRIFFKHVLGVTVWAYVPIADIEFVEFAMGEHFSHVSHIRHIPPTDIAGEFAPVEHPTHVNYFRHVPLADVAIE